MKSNLVTVTAGGQVLSGWTDVRITMGVERLPSDFEVTMTEVSPATLYKVLVRKGDAFQLKIGDDLVITGYIDHVVPGISPDGHWIKITGRSKCADLVDCSAEWAGGQISGSSALVIAQKLASVYGPNQEGIPVASNITDLPVIPQFNLMLGETPYEIIERICRYSAALVYDRPDGSLYLSRVGSTIAASGVVEGTNVQAAWVDQAADQIYSDYAGLLQSVEIMGDLGTGGNQVKTTTDPNCRRHRKLIIIAESGNGSQDLLQQRVEWEAAHRTGRSTVVRATLDSWRDSAGTLWTPNTLVPVELPTLKINSTNLVLGEVTFTLNQQSGHTAELTLMPAAAYTPQPVQLQTMPAELYNVPAS